MKITKVEVYPILIPYMRKYEMAVGSAEMGQRVIIKVFTDEGIVGFGEASVVIPDRTGENIETITFALKKYFAPLMIGEDPFNIQGVMRKLDQIVWSRYGFLYSKAAIDIALHDIMGKVAGQPIYNLLGGLFRRTIGVSRSLPITSPEETAQNALRLKEQGYKQITVKVGFDPDLDVKRVAAVRKVVGDDFPVEVDPNQGYRVPVAIPTLRKMEAFGILNIEQPCPWWDLDGMAEVARALDTPVTADESVLTPIDTMRVIEKRAADAITIKLAKSGGFLESRKIAILTDLAGICCNMGSQHPAGVGTAAILQFAAATPEVIEPIGYGVPAERFIDDILVEPLQMKNGTVEVPDKPGLGVEIDDKKLQKYATKISID